MADMEKIKELAADLVGRMRDEDVVEEDVSKVNENMQAILETVDIFHDIFGDGLQLTDVAKVGKAVEPLMKLAAGLEGYRGEDKRRFVTEMVWLMYRLVDTYPDGKHNNVNLPFVMGGLERKVERMIIGFAANMVVDALFDRLREEGDV